MQPTTTRDDPTRSVVLPGSGWPARLTVDATLLFVLVLTHPASVRWSWIALVAVRLLTLAASRAAGPGSPIVLGLDLAIPAAVAVVWPPTSLAILLPLLVVTVAISVTGLWPRLAMASAVTALVALTAVRSDPAAGAALAAGLVGAALLAWIVAEQTASLRAGTNSVLTWLRGRSARMLDATSEALVVTDPTGRVVQGNAAAAELVAVPIGELSGAHCAAMRLHQGLQELDCAAGCALMARAGDASDVEVWQGIKGGERRHLLARVSPVYDGRGSLVEVMHAFRDISGIRRSQEAETLFLAAASHELKTPLTVIRGFANLMRENELSEEERDRMLDTIIGRSAELSDIVARLLLTGRVGSGRLELSVGSVDVAAIASERAAALSEVSEHHRIVVSVEKAVPAKADAEALATVVDHLLENAVKYSPGGGSVVIEVGHDDHEVVLSVSDDGIGMSPADARRCFDRFWQGDVGERRRFGGTGVGLYLVHQLTHGMGGTVTADSEVDRGTTFTIRLARADAPAARHDDVVELRPGIVDAVMDHVGVRRSS